MERVAAAVEVTTRMSPCPTFVASVAVAVDVTAIFFRMDRTSEGVAVEVTARVWPVLLTIDEVAIDVTESVLLVVADALHSTVSTGRYAVVASVAVAMTTYSLPVGVVAALSLLDNSE